MNELSCPVGFEGSVSQMCSDYLKFWLQKSW